MLYSVQATATPISPPFTHTHTNTPRNSAPSVSLPLSQAINDNARVQFQFSKLVFSAKVATSSLRADKRQGISRIHLFPLLSSTPYTHIWRVSVCVCVCVCGRYCGSQTACQAVAVSVTHSFVHCTLCAA